MNATQKFVEFVTAKGFTVAEAEKILSVYKKAKVIKFGNDTAGFHVTHGALLEEDVLRNSINP